MIWEAFSRTRSAATRARAAPLAAWWHAKTDGNPFFVVQFLHVLADEGLLAFDHEQARWSWDSGGIQAKRYTDNVVELLVGKLTRLPLDTQRTRYGGSLASATSRTSQCSRCFSDYPEEEVHVDLWEALRQQLIERIERSYRFVHDRVQEAAYALIPENSRAEAHLTIGRLLCGAHTPEKRDESDLEIVNQLNRGAPLITSREDARATRRAKPGRGDTRQGFVGLRVRSDLSDRRRGAVAADAWERRQELAVCARAPAPPGGVLRSVRARCRPPYERLAALANARCRQRSNDAQWHTARPICTWCLERARRAVAVALECLRHEGIDWPAHPTEAEREPSTSAFGPCSEIAQSRILLIWRRLQESGGFWQRSTCSHWMQAAASYHDANFGRARQLQGDQSQPGTRQQRRGTGDLRGDWLCHQRHFGDYDDCYRPEGWPASCSNAAD